jgi:acetyltransferase-like isoleucine patch superfamily enzyme
MLSALLAEMNAWSTAVVFAVPGKLGQGLRALWCSATFGAWGRGSRIGRRCELLGSSSVFVGDGCNIGAGAFLSTEGGGRIRIGNRSQFNGGVHLNASGGGEIVIGSDCLVGPNVVMRTASHRFDDAGLPIREQGHHIGSIVLEDDVWIAAGAILLPGITIGRGSVIGAGAVVTRSTAPMSVSVGVPAKSIRQRGQA